MPTIQINVPSSAEPLRLAEVKLHLELDDTRYDAMVTDLMRAARDYAEKHTSKFFAPRTITEYFDYWPSCTFDLSYNPVTAVNAIRYLTQQYTIETWSADNYRLDLFSSVARVSKRENASYPSLPNEINSVQVEYVTGFVEAPAMVKQAMKMLIAFWYENREDDVIGMSNNPRIRSANALLDNYRELL
jgi:uncharacterized phiE125 gp8 family phage protein